MKFALFSLVMNLPNAITGETLTAQQKFQNILKQAILAEELGFEAYEIPSTVWSNVSPTQQQAAFNVSAAPALSPVFAV